MTDMQMIYYTSHLKHLAPVAMDGAEFHVEKIAKWAAVFGVGNNYKMTYPASEYCHSLQNNFD
jgi:hypothetical protein